MRKKQKSANVPGFYRAGAFGIVRAMLHYAYLMTGLFLLALLFSRFANWYWVA